jgi:hypothetical protein
MFRNTQSAPANHCHQFVTFAPFVRNAVSLACIPNTAKNADTYETYQT